MDHLSLIYWVCSNNFHIVSVFFISLFFVRQGFLNVTLSQALCENTLSIVVGFLQELQEFPTGKVNRVG